jgi:hypothetical protein
MPNQAGSRIGFSLNELLRAKVRALIQNSMTSASKLMPTAPASKQPSEKLKFNPSVNDQWNVGVRT